MPKVFRIEWVMIHILVFLAVGCKPQSDSQTAKPPSYFQTPFQSESQFIVEAIATDLAEQVCYAARQRLPDKNPIRVSTRERKNAPVDAPVYAMQIDLDEKTAPLNLVLNVNGPIWSPDVYQELAALLARTTGLTFNPTNMSGDTRLAARLLDATPETIEMENQSLSGALEKDFRNAGLHEQAALLLGAFLLRDHSGYFLEIRSPLCRMTAHLTLARHLQGTNAPGINGQLAEAMMLTLVHAQAPALERLKSIDARDASVAAMVRALQAYNTGDFRPLAAIPDPSPMESIACFHTMADCASHTAAWEQLDGRQKGTIDFVRAANELGYSVEIGHQLLLASLPLEQREIQAVYKISHSGGLKESDQIKALNALPERCLAPGTDPKPRVRIIGWGQWAHFLQRHLCHAMQQNFRFMDHAWGVHDAARDFAAQCDQDFNGLRLYPFVRRRHCTEIKAYHKSVDDGFKVTVATPHLVPAFCWNSLCTKPAFAPLYTPNPNPHVNEWHNHNPLPGTAYDLGPRLNHPSLIARQDVTAHFERLHLLAPYDIGISEWNIRRKYQDRPTYEQAMEYYGPLQSYSSAALRDLAATVENQPARYETLMLQAARLNPSAYYELARQVIKSGQEDKAADFYENAAESDPDAVRVASIAEWRVRYHLKKGQTAKARAIADFAGDVYSQAGLTAKAVFLESTTNYADAFDWYGKIEERYEDSWPLVWFCLRYSTQTGDSRFNAGLQQRKDVVFPGGMEKVSLNTFHEAPTNGVLIKAENTLLNSAGLKQGDVIVALDGIRTHYFAQYQYIRSFLTTPELKLIVWQGDAYREIKASPPNRVFGVAFDDYIPK